MNTKHSNRAPRARRLRLAGVASLAASAVVLSPLGMPTVQADPAPDAADTVLGVGDFSLTPAAGSCAAVVTVEGGNGGTAVSGGVDDANPDPDDPDQVGGGQGARIKFRIPLAPGDVLSGVVGAGGSNGGPGGASGSDPQTADHGGDGGTGVHRGGGGGGYTTFLRNGTMIALAGGGGGSGGGHNPNAGGGGHAGVIENPGTVAGQEGADGTDLDSVLTPDPANPGDYLYSNGPGGGRGGDVNAAGAGGVHPTTPAYNGSAAAARNGGQGGTDNDADQGGGGGAGYFGGGGGASTVGNVSGGNPGRTIIGGGGGGGSSFFQAAAGATLIAPANNSGDGLAPNGAQRNGTATVEWVPCNYDLAVTKTSSTAYYEAGVPVKFTVTVKNVGPEPMGIGDTVTMVDTNAAGATLLAVASSSKTDPRVTCDVAPGAVLATGTLDCSRPVGNGVDVRGLNVGESLVITYQKAFTGSAPVVNTVTIADRGSQANNAAVAAVKTGTPGLKLTKKANRKKVKHVGDRVVYTFRVRNTGNIPLHKIRIVEGDFSGKGHLKPKCAKLPNKELAPGKVLVCKATYRVTRADLKRGRITNTATAGALSPAGRPLASAPATAKVKARAPLPKAPNTGARTN